MSNDNVLLQDDLVQEENSDNLTEENSDNSIEENSDNSIEENSEIFDSEENLVIDDASSETEASVFYDDTVLLEKLQEQNDLLTVQNSFMAAFFFVFLFTIFDRFISRINKSIRFIGGGK